MGLPIKNTGTHVPLKNSVKIKAPALKNSICVFYPTPKQILSFNNLPLKNSMVPQPGVGGGGAGRVLDAIAHVFGGGNTTRQRLTKQCLVHAWLGGPQSWTK